MSFNSPLFLFLFLPFILLCYWLSGKKWRTGLLLCASIFYYTGSNIFNASLEGKAGGSGFIFLLIYYCVTNYSLGMAAARYRESSLGRAVIWLSLALNLGPLVWYKYSYFAAGVVQAILPMAAGTNLFNNYQGSYLPLGISFLTFQAIAYVLDVYREEIEPQRNLLHFSLFLALFPKVTAGPIIRYSEVAEDLADPKFNTDQFAMGVKRFVIGLGKKVILADTLARTADQIFSLSASELTATVAWLGLLTYTLQLYLDFSGYTDMAIGLGRMFGFKFQENFNYPYISRSLTEFWRRWHISLSTWLRDYLFIPLSYSLMTGRIRQKIAQGKYKTNYHTLFSIVIVFIICGLWHGAGWNFIVWGMLHGIVLALESLWLSKAIKKCWIPLQHCYLLLIVMLAWVFFRLPTLNGSFEYIRALMGMTFDPHNHFDLRIYIDSSEFIVLIAGILASTPVAKVILDLVKRRGYGSVGALLEISSMIIILVFSYCSIASSTFTPFLYQKF